MEKSNTVTIAKDLEELVPGFMEHRRQDLHALKVALGNDDLEGLRFIGDRIKGAAGSFGFARIAAIAAQIEEKAKRGDRTALHWLVEHYARAIASVEVVFEEGSS